ncbi:MAG: DUF433 domain-containing protein [Microthrixaceae bacterium]|nr:DUF433 domain-containing protein [Microthrixaceae bacterium]
MAGVPCITNTRIPVATVVSMVAEGASAEEIVREFSQLNRPSSMNGPGVATSSWTHCCDGSGCSAGRVGLGVSVS